MSLRSLRQSVLAVFQTTFFRKEVMLVGDVAGIGAGNVEYGVQLPT